MKCSSTAQQLEAYLDGELDRATVDEIEAHLTGCAACRARLATLEELRGAIRSVPRHRAPPQLRERLLAADEISSRLIPARGSGFSRWALAASLLAGFALGAGFMRWGNAGFAPAESRELFAQELLSSHLRALAAASPVDVISEDRHTVKPWFAGKIGESPPVVDLAAQDFPLIGGRIDYVGGDRVAVVVYAHRKHVIDVYMDAKVDDAQPAPAQLRGYALAPCRLGEWRAWVVTDVDAGTLLRFREFLGCVT